MSHENQRERQGAAVPAQRSEDPSHNRPVEVASEMSEHEIPAPGLPQPQLVRGDLEVVPTLRRPEGWLRLASASAAMFGLIASLFQGITPLVEHWPTVVIFLAALILSVVVVWVIVLIVTRLRRRRSYVGLTIEEIRDPQLKILATELTQDRMALERFAFSGSKEVERP